MLHGSIRVMNRMSIDFRPNHAQWRGVASCRPQETKCLYAIRVMTGRVAE